MMIRIAKVPRTKEAPNSSKKLFSKIIIVSIFFFALMQKETKKIKATKPNIASKKLDSSIKKELHFQLFKSVVGCNL